MLYASGIFPKIKKENKLQTQKTIHTLLKSIPSTLDIVMMFALSKNLYLLLENIL